MWTAIVVIVAVSMIGSVLIERYRAMGRIEKAKQNAIAQQDNSARGLAEQREIAELRERIKVLERIATDANTTSAIESRRVSDEIEALRTRENS